MKDPRGIERGACTKCECTAYEWDKAGTRAACAYCDCPAPAHENKSAGKYIPFKDFYSLNVLNLKLSFKLHLDLFCFEQEAPLVPRALLPPCLLLHHLPLIHPP